MSSLPGRKDGNGPPPNAPAPAKPIDSSTVLEVGPPLVPRHRQAPPPPPMKATKIGMPAVAPPLELDELIDDVDAGFGAITEQAAPAAGPPSAFSKSPSGGLSNARELFGQLAEAHFRHVRDFMIDVKAGQATTEWLALCEPSVKQVRQMSEQLALAELCALLDGYLAGLALAGNESGFTIAGDVRDRLLESYEPLVRHMPTVFALEAAKGQRDAVIVRSLLLQIPEVGKVTIDKLFGAGLTSLEAFFGARADDVATTTGLDGELAEKIVDRFVRYKKEMQSAAVDESRTFEHARLGELAEALAEQNRAYDDARGQEKREVRKAREATLLEIKVLLARLGEIERVAKIDKLPFAQKVAEVTAYLKAKV